jgi:hypothetical protein
MSLLAFSYQDTKLNATIKTVISSVFRVPQTFSYQNKATKTNILVE